MVRRVQVREGILRIEVGVADILEQLAMELVGAGLGRQVDDRAAERAVSGRWVVGLHLHLRNIRKRNRDGYVCILRLDVEHTIDQVQIALEWKAIYRRIGSSAPSSGRCRSRSGGVFNLIAP